MKFLLRNLPPATRIAAGLGAVWAFLIALFYLSGFFDGIEDRLVDWEQKAIASKVVNDDTALIAIAHVPSDRPWPWPRLDYALVLRGLIPEMPQSVVFEMLMNDHDPRFSAFDPSFARLIDRTNNVLFSAAALQLSDGNPLPDGLVTLPRANRVLHLPSFGSALWPVQTFAAHRPVGIANFSSDPDQVLRRLPLVFWVQGQIVPSLALNAAGMRLGVDWSRSKFFPGDEIVLRDAKGQVLRRIPIDDEGRLRLRFRRPGVVPLRINYDDFLLYADQSERGVTPAVDLKKLGGRQVWVGLTDPEVAELKETVIGKLPTVAIQLQATEQIVRGEFIVTIPRPVIALLFILTGTLLACAAERLSLFGAIGLLTAAAALIFALGIAAFEIADVSFPLISLLILIAGSFFCSRAAEAWDIRPEPAPTLPIDPPSPLS